MKWEGLNSDDEAMKYGLLGGPRCIVRRQGSVEGLLDHEELSFQGAPNQTTQLKWSWRHH
jgi:hypothetical protein